MKRFVFKIQKDGNVQLKDVEGMGQGCQDATADIEKLLGTVDEKSRSTTDSAAYVENDPLILKQEV